MKIIFLDIDGVMNTSASAGRLHQDGFDPIPNQCLKDILAATDAKIVVSGALGRSMSFESLRVFFERQGIPGSLVIGVTRWIGRRGEDISAWLEEHPEHSECYILIDDAGLDQVAPHGRRCVHTRWHIGMTPGHARLAIRLLNEERHP